jgi:hypothetical protein
MMKKIIFMGFVITFLIAASFVRADQVNMNISVNGTSNLNITVNADDTLARQMASQAQSDLNNTQTDVYGTMHHSGPKDMILNEITNGTGNPINGTEGMDKINEVCNDPYLQQWLSQLGNLPPQGFVDYVKALGYDDEAHADLIWNMCQEKYIQDNEGKWSAVGGGMIPGDLLSILKDSVGWLMGSGNTIYAQSKDIAMTLDSYFANKNDVWTLNNKINQLQLRVEALERTTENVSAEAYCQAKLDMMKEYNLTGVKCGTNSTMYWNAKKAGFDNYDTIAYNDCTENWLCVKWSDCTNGTQTRKCVDKNNCGTFYSKPAESQVCDSKQISAQQSISNPSIDASKVEILSTDQLLEKYMPMLMIAMLSIPVSLIIFGIKRDRDRKKKKNINFSY